MTSLGLRRVFLTISAMAVLMPMVAPAQDKTPPYWASLSKDEARMRTGPSTDYPANWIYRRRDLPVRVIELYSHWRKVEDPDGVQGWMHVRLLSDQPTAIVKDGVQMLREAPQADASVLFRAESGVVGRISDCDKGWCLIDVHGQKGFIQAAHIWGASQ
ncbi:MAG: hypothetical protein JJE34_04760 [Alphaproteobacteria bacterium]|nr:hypothetical protein [Alphaproteobacteria bacterium]